MTTRTDSPVFDYKALRLIVGIIAFALPFLVIWISSKELASISASYYSEARDVFVGLLFIVGAFLWAYNGHTVKQKIASKVAAICACAIALFPTSCDGCELGTAAIIHSVAAVVLFAILAYFCLGPFREKTKKQTGKKGRRARVYAVCGWAIIAAMLSAAIAKLVFPETRFEELRVIYWVELVSLVAFGVAWITAGKYLPMLVDEEDALKIFRSRE